MTPCWVRFFDNSPFSPPAQAQRMAVCSCGWESKRWAMYGNRQPRELTLEVVNHLVRPMVIRQDAQITPDVEILFREEKKEQHRRMMGRVMEYPTVNPGPIYSRAVSYYPNLNPTVDEYGDKGWRIK